MASRRADDRDTPASLRHRFDHKVLLRKQPLLRSHREQPPSAMRQPRILPPRQPDSPGELLINLPYVPFICIKFY